MCRTTAFAIEATRDRDANLPAGTMAVGIVFAGKASNNTLNCSRSASGRFLLEAEEVP
jgi:hypothetical protein